MEEQLRNDEKPPLQSMRLVSPKTEGGSTLLIGIRCDADACGTVTEEGERTAPDSFACTRVEARE